MDSEFIVHQESMTHAALQDEVARLENQLMNPLRPVWNMHIYENCKNESGKDVTSVVLRIHHSIADGFILLRAILQACDPSRPPTQADSPKKRQPGPKAKQHSIFTNVLGVLGAIKKLLIMQDDPVTVYKNGNYTVGDPNNVSWHELKYTVADIKTLGANTSATVNDVLLAALSHGLRKWGTDDKKDDKDLNISCVIWVSKSPMGDVYKSIEEKPLGSSERQLLPHSYT